MLKPLLHFWMIYIMANNSCASQRYRRGIEPFLRNNNKFFMRLNLKNNMFASNILIAYAAGYRINWDIAPALKERSSTSRQHLHYFMQDIMQRHGLDGEACIRKAACELTTHNPIDAVDHIIHLFLRREDEDALCREVDQLKLESYNCSFPLLGLTSYMLEQAFNIL